MKAHESALTNQHVCFEYVVKGTGNQKLLQRFSLVDAAKCFGFWLGYSRRPIMLCSRWFLSV